MLIKMIEKKRKQLVNIVAKYGLSSTEALNCSQELDSLIQSYQNEMKQLKQIQSRHHLVKNKSL